LQGEGTKIQFCTYHKINCALTNVQHKGVKNVELTREIKVMMADT